MQATARLKYLMMSPRKVRRVVTLVKGKSVDEALTILKFTNKAAASPLAKTIQSAAANALSIEGTAHLKAEDLTIASILIDSGPSAKRARFRAMGRVFRYVHRFAHITVVVEGEPAVEAKPKKKSAAKKSVKVDEKPAKKATAKKPAAKKKAVSKKPPAKKATPKKAAVKKTTSKVDTADKKKAVKTAKKDK